MNDSLPPSAAAGSSGSSCSTSNETIKVPAIKLEDREVAVLDLVDGFTKHLAKTRADLPSVECRVAGGWVRDKLLGMASEDLDICISSLTGHHFATLLESYIHLQKSDSDGTADPAIAKTKIAKIQANPDQSKHLETARMHVLGMEVDLVQLRSEEYANGAGDGGEGGSRIPTSIKFGTPLEDALRRDITINTLFYNIHTRQVEDWTQKGLSDLLSSSPLIRTPLEPLQTFLDDPLRILRCIRFASRFNFPLDPSIKPAVEDARVKRALLTKVSKERIGVELEKMLRGRDPLLSLKMIVHLSLYNDLFSALPSAQDASPLPEDAPQRALAACQILANIENGSIRLPEKLLTPLQDKTAVKRLWLALYLEPLRGLTFTEKKKVLPLTDAVVRDSIKLSGLDRSFVQHIQAASSKLSLDSLHRLATLRDASNERSSLGFLLRDPDVHNSTDSLDWRMSVLHALILEVAARPHALQDIIAAYVRFVDRIEELELDTRAFEKSRLDGMETIKLLGIKPGPITSALLQKVVEWQLDHPEGSKEECGQYIKAEYAAGHIVAPPVVAKAGNKKGKQ
ncbi:poly A polymerase C-terminal region-like protein [Cystobasidium minutum MCA 4210]|uniref:poly A polymerase C-terminal region-like protein n=1 Tax=Cystobasidium minutum MCA 4210 TaxID=1397322 RepID=UPI0034CD49BB|eukprot:jgi/Rhomi1/198073/gm1.6287_g